MVILFDDPYLSNESSNLLELSLPQNPIKLIEGFLLAQIRFPHHFFITALSQCYQHCFAEQQSQQLSFLFFWASMSCLFIVQFF